MLTHASPNNLILLRLQDRSNENETKQKINRLVTIKNDDSIKMAKKWNSLPYLCTSSNDSINWILGIISACDSLSTQIISHGSVNQIKGR